MREEERRPRQEAPSTTTATRSAPQSTDFAARARRHEYAVRVVSERVDGIVVTQYMTDLPAAERKRARTLARGLSCALYLVRVVPVGVAPLPLVATADELAAIVEGVADQ